MRQSLVQAVNCDPPPVIENTEAAVSTTSEIGEMVLYACVEGFTKVKGESRLTCTVSEGNTATWSGEPIECSNRNTGVTSYPHNCQKFA